MNNIASKESLLPMEASYYVPLPPGGITMSILLYCLRPKYISFKSAVPLHSGNCSECLNGRADKASVVSSLSYKGPCFNCHSLEKISDPMRILPVTAKEFWEIPRALHNTMMPLHVLKLWPAIAGESEP